MTSSIFLVVCKLLLNCLIVIPNIDIQFSNSLFINYDLNTFLGI